MKSSRSLSSAFASLSLCLLCCLLGLSACGTNTTSTPSSQFSNIPSGHGTDPEPGNDGKPHPTPHGHYESILADNGLVYIGSDNGSITALNAHNGHVHWQYHTGTSMIVYALVQNIIYAASNATLYALDATTGSPLWHFQSAKYISNVVVDTTTVYINSAAEQNSSLLYALTTSHGQLLWQSSLSSVMPTLYNAIDGTVFLVQSLQTNDSSFMTQTLYAMQASTGHMLWKTPLTGNDGLASGKLVKAQSTLYLATLYGGLYAVQANTGKLLWHISPAVNFPKSFGPGVVSPVVENAVVYVGGLQTVSAYRTNDGKRLWQYRSGPLNPSPASLYKIALSNGILYASSLDGHVVALRASNGSMLWQNTLVGNRALVFANNLVIDISGPVIALHASDGSMAWKNNTVGTGITNSGGPSEVAGDGVIFMGSDDGTVLALRENDGAPLWHYAFQEPAVPTEPVYAAFITFAPAVSYSQALTTITNLGLHTYVECQFAQWHPQGLEDQFPSFHTLTVAAAPNSAPLWLDRLSATPGITQVQPDGPHSCTNQSPGAGPMHLPYDQVHTLVHVTFTASFTYIKALTSINDLGFRLADPCYEQARAQNHKPIWHMMNQSASFNQGHTLLLATTSANATTWQAQLKATSGVKTVEIGPPLSC